MNERWRGLRNSFFAGLLVLVPIAASVMILAGLFTWVTNFLLPPPLRDKMLTPLYRVGALVVFVAATTLIGWCMRRVIGKRLHSATESLIGRVPLLNKTYGFMKEISQTLLSGKKTIFQQVVLLEFPRPGLYSLGFLTNETAGEAGVKTARALVSVFIPTTPNPTSGYLIMVPRDDIIRLDMTVAEGIKLVISGGSVMPPYPPAKRSPAGGVPGDLASQGREMGT